MPSGKPLLVSRKRAASVSSTEAPKRYKAANAKHTPTANCTIDMEDVVSFTVDEIKQIRLQLLAWYDSNHRILPWRRNAYSKKDPTLDSKYQPVPMETSQQQFLYYVWVCEVMSQQTQVPRVAEYFTKWIHRWPTVQDLAAATQEQVNDVWAGLGYYRRARLLLEGAQHVVANLSGQMPVTTAELQKIPGIGPYTGNAIASIAGNQRVAVVDANVIRVLARLRMLSDDQKSKSMVQLNAQLADSLVDLDRPGCFNQAMMELGACICTVHQPPACIACPIRDHCRAYGAVQEYVSQGGDANNIDAPHVLHYPAKVVKAARREEDVAVCVVGLLPSDLASTSDSQYLLVQRPEKGLLAGAVAVRLYSCASQAISFRHKVDASVASDKSALQQTADTGLPKLISVTSMSDLGNLEIERRYQLGTISHTFSHIQQTMHIELVLLKGRLEADAQKQPARKIQWINTQDITGLGLSSGVKKVWQRVMSMDKGALNGRKAPGQKVWKQQKMK